MRWLQFPAFAQPILSVLALSGLCAALPAACAAQSHAPLESQRVLSTHPPEVASPDREPRTVHSEGMANPREAAPQSPTSAEVTPKALPDSTEEPAASDLATTFRQPVVPHDRTVVRVLLYHSIGSVAPRPSVTLRAFRKQLEWIEDAGIEVIRLTQLLDFMEGKLLLPRHAALITIDDGESNGYSVAYQVLRELNVPFTLGIATDAIEERHKRGTLSWDQIREMVDSGLCEVASHSVTHRAMTALPDEVAQQELEQSRTILQEELGLDPQAFFYPLGAHDRRIRRLTRLSGYRAAFVAHGGPTVAKTPRFRIPRYDVKPEVLIWTFQSFFNHEIKMRGWGARGSWDRPLPSRVGDAFALRDDGVELPVSLANFF